MNISRLYRIVVPLKVRRLLKKLYFFTRTQIGLEYSFTTLQAYKIKWPNHFKCINNVLYNLFYSDHKFDNDCRGYLYAIKMIRNAAAHNNCLLNQMRAPYSRSITPSYELRNTINKISSLKADKVTQQLQNPTTHDFLALLIAYSKIVPESSRTKGLEAAKALFNERMLEHKDYYVKQQGLISTYRFVAEILNKLS